MVTEPVVKRGYKQTELGLIPDDWEVENLGEHVEITSGESPSKFNIQADGVPYFKVEQLNNCAKYQVETPYHIKCEKKVASGSVLFPKRGAAIFLNKIRLLRQDSYFDTNLMALTVDAKLSHEFLFYSLNYLGLDKVADTTSVPQINNKHIIPFKLAFPSKKEEQVAIAAVLSDTDALIESLDKLIAKKKAIKQGSMQQLLTGKKRLPGFCEDWVGKGLREIGEIVTGGTPPTHIKEYWGGATPWITPTDISDKKDVYSSEREISISGLQMVRALPANTVLVTCIASIGKNAILRVNGASNQQINAIIPKKEIDVDFLYYLIENNKQCLLGKAGITATLMISKKVFSGIVFLFPNNKPEQTVIASVLSDMDAEIEALEKKREKYFMLKQGMMQQLLTGKIRIYANN